MGENDNQLETARCPACLEFINAKATRCRFCGTLQEEGLKRGQGSRSKALQQAMAEELRREAAFVPLKLRRQLKILDFILRHHAVQVGVNGMLSVLVGIAAMSQADLYAHGKWWFWIKYLAGFGGFYLAFLLVDLWFGKILEVAQDHLLSMKDNRLKQGATLERLKKEHLRTNRAASNPHARHEAPPKAHLKHLNEI